MSTRKIIFFNQKGGVGKTTTCVNLGAALAALNYKVLLVDFDSQSNLTGSISGNSKKATSYDVITGKVSAMDAVQPTMFQNLFLIPANLDLAGLNVELADEDDKDFFLKKTTSCLDSQFDYILLDCPPSIDVLTMNALCWADSVIIPLQCEYLAMEGLNLLMRTVTNVKKSINPNLEILGILFTMFSKRSRLNSDVIEDVSQYFPDLVFKTIIPRSVRLAEAPSHGLPINVYDSSNSGTKAYAQLAKEVISRGN